MQFVQIAGGVIDDRVSAEAACQVIGRQDVVGGGDLGPGQVADFQQGVLEAKFPGLAGGSSWAVTTKMSMSEEGDSSASSGSPTVEPLKYAPRKPASGWACWATHWIAAERASPTFTAESPLSPVTSAGSFIVPVTEVERCDAS